MPSERPAPRARRPTEAVEHRHDAQRQRRLDRTSGGSLLLDPVDQHDAVIDDDAGFCREWTAPIS